MAKALESLQNILSTNAGEDKLSSDIGDKIKKAITHSCHQAGEHLQVAVVTEKHTEQLTQSDLSNARQSTTLPRTKLQSLMQSNRLVRNQSGYAGALNIRNLHCLGTGNTKVFLRKGKQAAASTGRR